MLFLITISGGEFLAIAFGLLGQLMITVGAVILGLWIYDRYIKQTNTDNT